MCATVDVNVHSWATSLRCHHWTHTSQPLTPQHFSVLSRNQNFAGILMYLVRHLRPPEEQHAIKLNLKHAAFRKHLRGGGEEQEEEEGGPTSEGQLRLRAALLDTNMAIAAEVKEIQFINQRLEEGWQDECEARRRAATLATARRQAETATSLYHRWTCHLDQLQQHGSGDGGATSVTVQRQLKVTLTDIEKFHHTTVTDQPYSPEDTHDQKVCLWEGVGASLEKCGPRALLGALVGEVRAATRGLHTLLQNVDLARDARELRLKCENDGTFIDESNPRGVVKDVKELLHLMCASHVQLYLQAHKDNTHAASLTRALTTLTNNISTAAKSNYSDEAVSACVLEIAQENIALMGERAALSTTLALISNLQQRAAKATQARDEVRTKHTRILTFDRKVQEALSTIHNLAAAVEEGWPEIENILEQLQASVVASLALLTSPTPTPPHSMATEGDAYMSLPLACLLTTDCDGLGQRQKMNLSTTPLLWQPQESTQAMWEVVAQLKQGITSWEGVYQAVCERLAQTDSLHSKLDRLSYLGPATPQSEAGNTSAAISIQEMKKLKEEVKEHDEREEAELVHLAEDFERELSRGDQLAVAVTRLLQDWWEQPAKTIQVKKN